MEVKEGGIMESNLSQQHHQLTHAEIIKNATIIDEGIKLCPLCRNEVRLFFINFNEKILMCENVECEYPFGYEDIIYLKEDINIQSNEEVASIIGKPTCGSQTMYEWAACSVISTTAMSEIDKINKVNDLERQHDQRPEPREYYRHKNPIKEKKQKKVLANPKMLKKIDEIAKMHEEMKPDDRCIKNEKWITKLMNMQQSSGLSLLKPEEMSLFKQKKPEFGLGELTIDINKDSAQNMSAIKIEIANFNPSNGVKAKT